MGRVWYPVKVLNIRHNLFAVTETLTLSIYEPIAIRVLWERGRHPFGRRIDIGIPCESPP